MNIVFTDYDGTHIKIGMRVAGLFDPLDAERSNRFITRFGTVVALDSYYEPADVNGEGACYPRIKVSWPESVGEEWISASYQACDDVWLVEDIEFAI